MEKKKKKSERNIRVSVYLTPAEQSRLATNFKIDLPIEGQAKLKLFAAAIRCAALGTEFKYKNTNPVARQQFAELARLSSNLNQYMHAYNSGEIADVSSAIEIVKQLKLSLLNITNKNES